MKTLKPLQLNRKLRRWQEKAMRRFSSLNKKDFLIVATPGGGKTFVALRIAYDLLIDGKIERIVIVTPTEHLKRQWAEDAALLGIDLDFNWQNSSGRESVDYFGVAVTYHQVSFAPDIFDLNCRKKTLVIFDEIHHAGDNLEWGFNLRQAFKSAQYRFCLSGTPFRSDDNPIPFVNYVDQRSQSDFTYGYGEALADGVCRPIYFPTVEGNVSWIRPNGKEMDCSMLDELSRVKANERLRTALDADGQWLPEVLREADSLLSKMRFEGHTDAAGLVIALDQYHARKIAQLLQVITNEPTSIAISDEDDSLREIQRFAAKGNNKRWIVAVKMISEGVDIPRLRVGVYATTILSELFFRQVVGRFVRMIQGLDEQSAALFLPFDQRLEAHALAIKDEREHVLPEKITTDEFMSGYLNSQTGQTLAADGEIDLTLTQLFSGSLDDINPTGDFLENPDLNLTDGFTPDGVIALSDPSLVNDSPSSGNTPVGTDRKFIIPLSSMARMHRTVFNGERFSRAELSHAETISQQIGMRNPPAQIANLIRLVAPQFSFEPTNAGHVSSFQPKKQSSGIEDELPVLLSDKKHQLRREINKLANRLANLRKISPEEVHRQWITQHHGTKSNKATETELRKKYEWLKAEIIQTQQKRDAGRK